MHASPFGSWAVRFRYLGTVPGSRVFRFLGTGQRFGAITDTSIELDRDRLVVISTVVISTVVIGF